MTRLSSRFLRQKEHDCTFQILPCYSECDPWTHSTGIPPELLETQDIRQHPELLRRQFHQGYGRSVRRVKFGKHCSYECWTISDLMPLRYSVVLNVLVSLLLCLQLEED